MLADLSILNVHISPLSLGFSWIVRPAGALQLKASHVEGYGEYDPDQLAEQYEALSGNPVEAALVPDIAPEEFEAVYQWFLS
jgi:hypothetical protein